MLLCCPFIKKYGIPSDSKNGREEDLEIGNPKIVCHDKESPPKRPTFPAIQRFPNRINLIQDAIRNLCAGSGTDAGTKNDGIKSTRDKAGHAMNETTLVENDSGGDSDSTTSRQAPSDEEESCAVCLSQYHLGDEVCESRNPECSHKFHRTCIEEWLMHRDDCPCCRKNYFGADYEREREVVRCQIASINEAITVFVGVEALE